jgi:hypothetical protein
MIRLRHLALLRALLALSALCLAFLALGGCAGIVSEDPSKKSAQDAAQIVALLQAQLPEIIHRYAPATNPADLQAAVAAAVKAALPVAQDPAGHPATDAALQALPAVIQAIQPLLVGAGGPFGGLLAALATATPGLAALLLHAKKSQPQTSQQVLAQVLGALASAAPKAPIVAAAPTVPPAAPAPTP